MKDPSNSSQKIVKWGLVRPEGRFYAFGPFSLDAREWLLLRGGEPVPLTRKVFETLLLLVRHHGRLLTKEELMTSLWGDTVVEEGNLSQNVFILRKTLGDSADEPVYIETVPRVGYRFVGSVTESGDPTPRTGDVEPGAMARTAAAESASRIRPVSAPSPTTVPTRIGVLAGRRFLGRRVDAVWLGVLSAALIVGAALSWHVVRPPAQPPEPPTFHHLGRSGRDWAPAGSPDGGTIAFVSDRDGRRRIWLKQVAGESEFALTSGTDDRPRFSPDGSAVLFSRDEGDRRSLYRTAVLGGEPRKVSDNAVEGDWSPDGRRIVFIRVDDENGQRHASMGLASADGGDARQILRLEASSLDSPRWSPDGRRIVVRQAGGSTGVRDSVLVVDPNGGGSRVLDPPGPPGRISSLAWSGPDAILYAQSESLTSTRSTVSTRIVRLDVMTGTAQDIVWVPERIESVDLLGPGRLVFDANSTRESLRESALSAPAVAEGRWLTRELSNDRQPAYSPDGKWVVFSSDRTRHLDLWKVSTRDGALQRITDDAADDWDPAWTRDGKTLVWSSNRSGAFEVWIAAADGSGARQLTHDGVDAENPTPTPDGQWVVYSSANPAHAGVWKIRVDGSQATRLVEGAAVWPEVSPDGRFASYRSAPYDWPNARTGSVTVRVVRIADAVQVPFEIHVKEGLSAGRSRWMPDARAIAFVGTDERGGNVVFAQDFKPGQDTAATRRVLGRSDPAMAESFGISNEGSRITIAVWEQLSSLMVADGVPGLARR